VGASVLATLGRGRGGAEHVKARTAGAPGRVMDDVAAAAPAVFLAKDSGRVTVRERTGVGVS
jgi:hypothetical protein